MHFISSDRQFVIIYNKMRQNQQKQPNMESYKNTTELINKIKEDDCFNSYTIDALRLMYNSSWNTKLSWLDIVAGHIQIKYKVSKEMAYEAAQQFKNPYMTVQKCG